VFLHSTPATLMWNTAVTFDAMIVVLSGVRYACACVLVYQYRATHHCLPEEVGVLDRLHWYAAAVNGFLFCMLPVLLDPLRVPKGIKIIAYVFVVVAMLKKYAWLMERVFQEKKFPEYHTEVPLQLWIQPLKALDHVNSGFAMIGMFFARAAFWQIIMGEDFTLLRGRFRLAL